MYIYYTVHIYKTASYLIKSCNNFATCFTYIFTCCQRDGCKAIVKIDVEPHNAPKTRTCNNSGNILKCFVGPSIKNIYLLPATKILLTRRNFIAEQRQPFCTLHNITTYNCSFIFIMKYQKSFLVFKGLKIVNCRSPNLVK